MSGWDTILGILAVILVVLKKYIKDKRMQDAEKVIDRINADPLNECMRQFNPKNSTTGTADKTGTE